MEQETKKNVESEVERPAESAELVKPAGNVVDRTFGLRYVLALVFGAIFVPCLMVFLTHLVSYLVGYNTVYPYMNNNFSGTEYVTLMTAIVIFGGLHLWLNQSVKKSADEPQKKYQKVLSIIYSAGFAIVGIIGLWMMASELMEVALGFDTADETLIKDIFTGIIMVLLSGVAVVEQMKLFKKAPKWLYLVVMSVVSVVTIVMFFVFPAKYLKNARYDENLVSDLYDISNVVDEYYYENYDLAYKLEDYDFGYYDLNFGLENFEYKRESAGAYEICAVFKTDTMGKYAFDSTYFPRHEKGRYCFSEKMSGYSVLPMEFNEVED